VLAGGRVLPNAVAHDWIDGQTFAPGVHVDERFFPRLRAMVAELHSRDLAYVDLSKWENILVGDDGRPYLIDYQIHFHLPPRWPLRWWLRWLQAADLYYLHRHWSRARPEQLPAEKGALWKRQPGIVWIAETLGVGCRTLRRLLLRLLGVRRPSWKSGSCRIGH
jgi:hypothetical protein